MVKGCNNHNIRGIGEGSGEYSHINPELHIGELIREEMVSQGRSAAWLANIIHCDRRNIYDIFKRESIDTRLLMRISCVLEKDFFKYYSEAIIQNGVGDSKQ